MLVSEAVKIVQEKDLTVWTSHDVAEILGSKGGLRLSDNRFLKYQALMLKGPVLQLHTCAALNPATFLPETAADAEHDCQQITAQNYDLLDTPLANCDLNLYNDVSSSVENGVQKAGYAVLSDQTVLESNSLSPGVSAQLAELIALTQALKLGKGKKVNIYTDSRYAYLVLHAHAAIWKKRESLTSAGTPIKYHKKILDLLQAVQEPKEAAALHCRDHQKGDEKAAEGNRQADLEAKGQLDKHL
ncbi:uncharacterized protein LOC128929052 [Callithrix jacchus]